jgi:hypothetical protein
VTRTSRRVGIALALVSASLAIVGCGTGPTGTPVDSCPLASTEGTREVHGTEMWMNNGASAMRIQWTRGYVAATVGGAVVVQGPDGRVVARPADRVVIPGGFINGGWLACGTLEVESAVPS